MRVASIGYACASGLGHLNKWFYQYGVTDEVFVVGHPEYGSNMDWFPGAGFMPLRTRDIRPLMDWIDKTKPDVMLFFETPFWWIIPEYCWSKGIKTVMVPMHEWFPVAMVEKFDLYLSPSALDHDLFKYTGRSVQVTIPVDPSTWVKRTKVCRYLHNAGHVGHREHKGTRQLLEAMHYVTKPINLTVAGQGRELERLIREYEGFEEELSGIDFQIGEGDYSEMFPPEFDAYVAPEKLNGLSLPLQEARAAGMLVITTDRYPTNTWLPREPLIIPEGYQKAKVCSSCFEIDEAIVNPREIARVLDAWYDVDISEYSESGWRWAGENCWGHWAPKYRKLMEAIL